MIVGAIKNSTGNIRLGFLFLTAMLALPVPILARVDVPAGSGEARVWSESRKEVREE
jgi:UMF1 family MFS transporter